MPKDKDKSKQERLALANLAWHRGNLHYRFTQAELNTLEAAWADYFNGTLAIEDLAKVQEPIEAAARKRTAGKGKS